MSQGSRAAGAPGRIRLALGILSALHALPAPADGPQAGGPRAGPGAAVVARVNGEAVTEAELRRFGAGTAPAGERDGAGGRRLALERAIHERLLVQEARRRRLTVPEEQVDEALSSLRRRFEDLRSFGAWMHARGLDDGSLVEGLRAGLLAGRAREALAADAHVSDEQLRRYHEAHREELRVEEVRLQIIVVETRTAAAEVLEALHAGREFGGLARERSVGKRAARGGDTGWVEAGTLWPELRQVVARLKPRAAVGPLARGDGFLVVRLDGRRPGRVRDLAEVRPELERRLRSTARQEVVRAWLAREERRARIELASPRMDGAASERIEKG